MTEKKRGCGWRKVFKLYLVGEGRGAPCDRLPLKIEPCECCGFKPTFSRGFQWIRTSYIGKHETLIYLEQEIGEEGPLARPVLKTAEKCSCSDQCPVCHPKAKRKYGLMWASSRFYEDEDFVAEANSDGISLAISEIPKALVFGATWILVAHKRAVIYPKGFFGNDDEGLAKAAPVRAPAFIYAFKPARAEMLHWDHQPPGEEYRKKMEAKGVTFVPVEPSPWNVERHGRIGRDPTPEGYE